MRTSNGDSMEKIDPSSILIADAGPIIHLDEIDALGILSAFDVVLVPPIVWQEVKQHRPLALTRSGISFSMASVTSFPSAALSILINGLSLDRGEQEALLLMQQHAEALFATDDAAARFAAIQLGFRVHGTIGLLVRAVRTGHLPAPTVFSLLQQIPARSTLFVRSALLAEMLADFKKEFGV